MDKNIWLDGIMGVVLGDALGCPVQFMRREELRKRGAVTGMEGHGTYDMPPGTWTDDSSMTLATLVSIRDMNGIDREDIMNCFVAWYEDGEYTPYGQCFDEGNTCSTAIVNYIRVCDLDSCGQTSERSNGNGSLMRILPVCLYACDEKLEDEKATEYVHQVSGLTHNHLRSKMGCGLYYFCVQAVLNEEGTLKERLQAGLDRGFAFYEQDIRNRVDLAYYSRLRDLNDFGELPETKIISGGYVVTSLEAAIWSLLRTESFKEALLCAVNLADDSDTIGAIAGGLAGLFYGYQSMPEEWLKVIPKRDWIEELCRKKPV